MFVPLAINSLISIAYSCSSGQYYNNLTDSCLSCLSNCISCSSGTICSRCSQNYYISGNRCNMCKSSSCTCNGLILDCNYASNMSQIFVYIVAPICVIIIIVILGCLLSKKCQSVPVSNSLQNSNQELFMKIQPNINNLGILTMVMKNKWIQNNQDDIIDEKAICPICLGDQCEVLTICKHAYHSKCLNLWVKQQCNCPVCKRENISHVRKFCRTCHKNYIDTSLKQLKEFISQLMNVCSNCKAQKNRRLDSLCQMQLYQNQ